MPPDGPLPLPVARCRATLSVYPCRKPAGQDELANFSAHPWVSQGCLASLCLSPGRFPSNSQAGQGTQVQRQLCGIAARVDAVRIRSNGAMVSGGLLRVESGLKPDIARSHPDDAGTARAARAVH